MSFLNKWIDRSIPKFESMFTEENGIKSTSSLNRILFKILMYAVLSAVFLLVINVLLITLADTEKGGVFGDFMGGVLNPILTFFTLFGLIATIVIQRQELRLARIEYEKTADALSTQAVETTFFNILDLHHKIVDNIKVDINDISQKSATEKFLSEIILKQKNISRKSVFEGRGAFEEILSILSFNSSSPQEVVERYKSIQNDNNHVLGHYFRNLYQALKVIDGYDENILSKKQKRKYSSILRAQLSTKELALLFINCLEDVSDKGQFKNLIIEYAMLEHLPIKKIQGGYSLAGAMCAMADDDMFLQYKNKKELGINLDKCFGGAFGQNRGVPYDLRPSSSVN
ncbi:putative phage abortive infection protein [Pectobacterium brasiliense]|uniref:putative phage abortive infection protein n=1 Tax=Pectobacterium brasiliense TaxID=180957 RepID=UPI0032EE6BBC